MATDLRLADDLGSCCNAPSHCVPTVQYRLLNIDLPLSTEQIALFSQPSINPFSQVLAPSSGTNAQTSQSDNLIPDTFKLTSPFVMMGACVYAYGEPDAFAMDANMFGSQAAIDAVIAAGDFPGSPLNLRTDAEYIAQLNLATSTLRAQAQLEWGSPTWKAVWAFMNTFRLRVECPGTTMGSAVIDELLTDIGNCCGHSLPEGFGSSKTNWSDYVRAVNARLVEIHSTPNCDGYVLPFNCDQAYGDAGANPAEAGTLTPYRAPVETVSFGREMNTPTLENWYRLSSPMAINANTPIRITLVRNNDSYLARFLSEATVQVGSSIGAATASTVELSEDSTNLALRTHESSTFIKVPGGKMRIGIGLKGFFCQQKVCGELNAIAGAGACIGF